MVHSLSPRGTVSRCHPTPAPNRVARSI
jgi:hypothetical protein